MTTQTNSRAASVRRVAGVALATSALAACSPDRILTVEDPDVIRPESVQDITTLSGYLTSAIGDFQVAYAGSNGQEGQMIYSGLLSDELINTETFPTRIEIDARDINDDNSNNNATYSALARARASAERAAAQYGRLQTEFLTSSPARVLTVADSAGFYAGRAEAFALAGLTYIYFYENYCAPIPFSEVDENSQIVPSAPETRQQVYERAKARLDSGLRLTRLITTRPTTGAGQPTATQRAQSQRIENLILIAKGRLFLNHGDAANSPLLDSARTVVATVPTSYVYSLAASENSGRQNNGGWIWTVASRRFGVAERQGGAATNGNVGLPYRSAATNGVDVRTFTVSLGANSGFDRASTLFAPLGKYPARNSPTVVANGVEARLIEAEVALRGGDATTWAARHNALRADVTLNQCTISPTPTGCQNPTTGLAPLVPPATAEAQARLHFEERAYWLFLTGHRLGDMRRMVRQYGFAMNTVFPTGRYEKPLTSRNYGTDVSFPIPIQERSNSLFPQTSPTCDNTIA